MKNEAVTFGRREFLRIAGVSAAALASLACGARAENDDQALARPELLAALGDGPVRAIGVHYRAMAPGERNAAALRDAIHASRPWRERIFGGVDPSLDALVRDDFAHGRTVVVDGWVLSVTEARQCALFSLRSA